MTGVETRLALAMDDSLRSMAKDPGIAYETARTKTKTIFAKLGVSRQSELVGFLLRSETAK